MAIIGLFCKEINNKELLFIKNKFLNPTPQPVHLPRDLRGGCNAGDGRRDDEDFPEQQRKTRRHRQRSRGFPRLHRGQIPAGKIYREHCRCCRSSERE